MRSAINSSPAIQPNIPDNTSFHSPPSRRNNIATRDYVHDPKHLGLVAAGKIRERISNLSLETPAGRNWGKFKGWLTGQTHPPIWRRDLTVLFLPYISCRTVCKMIYTACPGALLPRKRAGGSRNYDYFDFSRQSRWFPGYNGSNLLDSCSGESAIRDTSAGNISVSERRAFKESISVFIPDMEDSLSRPALFSPAYPQSLSPTRASRRSHRSASQGGAGSTGIPAGASVSRCDAAETRARNDFGLC